MNKLQKGLTVAAIVLAGGAGGYALKSQTQTATAPAPTATAVATATPTASVDSFSISNVKAAPKGESGITQVDGDIVSAAPTVHDLKLVAAFVDKQGKTVATATGTVTVGANATQHFQLMTTDFISTYATVTVTVSEVIK